MSRGKNQRGRAADRPPGTGTGRKTPRAGHAPRLQPEASGDGGARIIAAPFFRATDHHFDRLSRVLPPVPSARMASLPSIRANFAVNFLG